MIAKADKNAVFVTIKALQQTSVVGGSVSIETSTIVHCIYYYSA